MAVRLASPSYIGPDNYTDKCVNVWDPLFREKLVERRHRLYDVLLYSSKFDIVASEAINEFSRGLEVESFSE